MSLAAGALSGCIAAAAVPILAGGAIVRTATDGEDGFEDRPEPVDGNVTVDPSDLDAAGTDTLSNGTPRFAIIEGEMPRTRSAVSRYADFTSFAAQLPLGASETETLVSVLLRNPEKLDGERLECTIREPAVLIDLDPGDRLFQDATDLSNDADLADTLANLRARGVSIFWISGRTADAAPEVRNALKLGGLDTQGADRIVLMRYPSDRKQTRRRALAETHCLLAILGDRRSDFDELFDFLVEPKLAEPLDSLLGNGWFLPSSPTVNTTQPTQ